MKTPKEQFKANKGEAGEFAAMLDNPILQKAITYALAQMASTNTSLSEISGANMFVATLSNLPKDEPKNEFPQRTLKSFET